MLRDSVSRCALRIASCAFSVNFVVLAMPISLFVGAHPRLTSMQMHFLVQNHHADWLSDRCRRTTCGTKHHDTTGVHALAAPARLGLPGSEVGHQLVEVGLQALQCRVV